MKLAEVGIAEDGIINENVTPTRHQHFLLTVCTGREEKIANKIVDTIKNRQVVDICKVPKSIAPGVISIDVGVDLGSHVIHIDPMTAPCTTVSDTGEIVATEHRAILPGNILVTVEVEANSESEAYAEGAPIAGWQVVDRITRYMGQSVLSMRVLDTDTADEIKCFVRENAGVEIKVQAEDHTCAPRPTQRYKNKIFALPAQYLPRTALGGATRVGAGVARHLVDQIMGLTGHTVGMDSRWFLREFFCGTVCTIRHTVTVPHQVALAIAGPFLAAGGDLVDAFSRWMRSTRLLGALPDAVA